MSSPLTPKPASRGKKGPVLTAAVDPAPLFAPFTPEEFERARRWLMRQDPRLAPLIKRVGRCCLPDSRTNAPFGALVRAILAQQLSGKAADTIHRRVLALVGGAERLAPQTLLDVDVDQLRAAGVSRPKISYLRDLAEHVIDGRLNLAALELQSDEEVIQAITAVRGLGRWSAEMFLMFHLNRPDVFPVADLGIVKGIERLLSMKRRPAARTMLRAAEAWRPYRSVAAWYLWRLQD
ncbi:MAG: DNA-3-methyladenine glycosylase [Vicinamibacterales bacterium]